MRKASEQNGKKKIRSDDVPEAVNRTRANGEYLMNRTSMLNLLLTAMVVIVAMAGYHISTQAKDAKSAERPVTRRGVVTGIFYTEDDPSAMVGEKIVHEGDMLRGVKVIKIHLNKIEFEKNGKSWSQQVQEGPNPEWVRSD